jgi:nucleoside-diphosphate-sugar epimerase
MGRKILITGATGLVGSYLLDTLKDSDDEIFVISHSQKSFSDNITFIKIDLAKEWDFRDLPKEMDVIVHLAQSENFRLFPDTAQEVYNVNTVSTLRLADYARLSGVKNFIYASSAGIYGSSNGSAFTENTDIVYKKELGFYLATKLSSEMILENYQSIFNVVMLRYFFIYGTGQKRGMLIPRLIDNVIDGKSIRIEGDKGLLINPTHAQDAAEAVIRSMDLNISAKINIGGPDTIYLKEIVDIIGQKLTKTPIFDFAPKKENFAILGDITEMKLLLGAPQISFNEGINSLIP